MAFNVKGIFGKSEEVTPEDENYNITKEEFREENALKQDISKEDLTTFEKRKKIINIILQEAIKNGNMYVQIIYTGESNFEYERFKIEVIPVLRECGITVKT